MTEQAHYRADVDGLRALAVLSVIGFHAFPHQFRGGFVGVDVFFVISGYLITSNILDGLVADRFSFQDFYARRIRRIFPALLVVLGAVLVAGWFLFLPAEYKQLGEHAAAGAGFIPNLVLWHEDGYFDTSASAKPLLHLWSLGVEEQFYACWPLLLWFARGRFRVILAAITTIALASFGLNVWTARTDAAFYSPLSRFWELMIGGGLSYFRPRLALVGQRSAAWLSSLGALLIVGAVLTTNRETSLPGWWTLAPTVGAGLAIAAGPAAWFNRILSLRPVVWIGLISYPLYLWHWPLLSIAQIVNGQHLAPLVRIGLACCAIALAWLTYELIEKPIRYGRLRRVAFAPALLCFALATAGIGGYAVYQDNGVEARFSGRGKDFIAVSRYDYFQGESEADFWGQNGCFLLSQDFRAFDDRHCLDPRFPGRPTVLLIGDSHAAYLSPALRSFLENRQVNMEQATAAYCAPLASPHTTQRCADIDAFILRRVAEIKPDAVVLFAQYGEYANPREYEKAIAANLANLAKSGSRRIIVLGQIPMWEENLPPMVARRYLARGQDVPIRTYSGVMARSLEWDSIVRDEGIPPGVTYVSLRDLLCNQEGCLVRVGNDLEHDLIVFDRGHLTQAGAVFVVTKGLRPLLPN